MVNVKRKKGESIRVPIEAIGILKHYSDISKISMGELAKRAIEFYFAKTGHEYERIPGHGQTSTS
jgi:hypothetical protein